MTHPAFVPPLAIERYRILEPHLADGVTLADLARASSVSERTLQRWLARYRSEGLAGLARISRADRGRLHLPDHLVVLARDLAIKRPRPPVAAIHRKVQELAVMEGHRPPSYAAVARARASIFRPTWRDCRLAFRAAPDPTAMAFFGAAETAFPLRRSIRRFVEQATYRREVAGSVDRQRDYELL